MLSSGTIALIKEISLTEAKQNLDTTNWISAVGHEVTADVLTILLDHKVEFNRMNLSLSAGDNVICVIPSFRASEAREFTQDEIKTAEYRCFHITIRKD